jgi:3-carboxy-cis,cis-muconate cycloisomerase
MLANLEEMQGLALSEAVSVALAAGVGRARAHELVEEACRRTIAENRPLRDVLLESPQICRHLSQADIDRLLDPRNYLGSAQCFIARVIGARHDSH